MAGDQGRAVCAVALYHAVRASGNHFRTAVGVAAGDGADGVAVVEAEVKEKPGGGYALPGLRS